MTSTIGTVLIWNDCTISLLSLNDSISRQFSTTKTIITVSDTRNSINLLPLIQNVLVVPLTDARSQPRTVMVVPLHTMPTNIAMVGPRWPEYVTCEAELIFEGVCFGHEGIGELAARHHFLVEGDFSQLPIQLVLTL